MASTLDMAAVGREHHEWMQQILAANPDLAQRIQALGVSAELDQDDDVLYLNIGPPTEALTESVDGRTYVRVEPDTLKIVGLEVWQFAQQQPGYPLGITLFLIAMLVVGAVRPVPAAPAEEPSPPQQLADRIHELLAAA